MEMRIGPKKNFMRESLTNELEANDKALILQRRSDAGIEIIDLILEPNKFDELGSEARLTFDEYCQTINELVEEEEGEWHELRMKDQVNITRDKIMQKTILKYAKEHYKINEDEFVGKDLNFTKRYDGEGRFIGEAVVISLTKIPVMGMQVK